MGKWAVVASPGGLKRYFPQFGLVEVQQTFYKPPQAETPLRWREEAPGDFEFTLKAGPLITPPPPAPPMVRRGVIPFRER